MNYTKAKFNQLGFFYLSLIKLRINDNLNHIPHDLDRQELEWFKSQMNLLFPLQQVEESFPEQRRIDQIGKNLREYMDWLFGFYNVGKNCPNQQCTKELRPSPKGTVPGF